MSSREMLELEVKSWAGSKTCRVCVRRGESSRTSPDPSSELALASRPSNATAYNAALDLLPVA